MEDVRNFQKIKDENLKPKPCLELVMAKLQAIQDEVEEATKNFGDSKEKTKRKEKTIGGDAVWTLISDV